MATKAGAEPSPRDDTGTSPSFTPIPHPELFPLLQEGLAQHPALHAARARLAESAAAAQGAGASRLPSLDASVQAGRSGSVRGPSNDFRATLSFGWELDIWNRLGSSTDAASLDREALALDLAGAELSLAANVTKAWLDAIEARQQLAVSRRLEHNLAEHLRIVEARYRTGLSGAADVEVARGSLANERSRLAERERIAGDRLRALELLLGRYPAGRIAVPDALPRLPEPLPAGLPAELLARRPDIRAAEARARASNERHEASHRERFPRFSLTASGGQSSSELSRLLQGDNLIWSLFANLTQPIFDGGRRAANEQQAAARSAQASARYGEVVLQAFGEVEAALAFEATLRDQRNALEDSLAAAERAEALTADGYQYGIENALAMLEIKRRTDSARSSLLDLDLKALKNRVSLALALGGNLPAAAREDTKP